MREQACQGALTQKQTLGRWFECPSSLLERLQGRIALEALGERRGALVSDAVASEPVNERWSGDGERSGVSRGADTKANTLGAGGALQRGHGALLERLAQLGDALGGVGAAAILIEATDLVVGQAASMGGSESVSGR